MTAKNLPPALKKKNYFGAKIEDSNKKKKSMTGLKVS